MPDLGLEFHDRRAEGILGGDSDVNREFASFVRRIGWSLKLSAEMRQIIFAPCRLNDDVTVLIILDVGDLLGNAAGTVGGHYE
jgi:hypothetical protein